MTERIRPVLFATACLTLLCALTGCNYVFGLTYMFGPPRDTKAEVGLTPHSLAIVVDYRYPEQRNPVFEAALYSTFEQIIHEHPNVDTSLVPHRKLLHLRQRNDDFNRWSVQRIGRTVGASEVLYLEVESLNVRQTAGYPIIEPRVILHAKLIDTEAMPPHHVIWPPRDQEPDGREIAVSRHPAEAGAPTQVDSEVRKLGIDTARHVAWPFFDQPEGTRIMPAP